MAIFSSVRREHSFRAVACTCSDWMIDEPITLLLLLLLNRFSCVHSVRPQRRQSTRLPRPWDSPGKSTGVGCHFLLQCMKVKSESEVAQSCRTPSNPMDRSLPGSSAHGIFQARVLEWAATAPRPHQIITPFWPAFTPGWKSRCGDRGGRTCFPYPPHAHPRVSVSSAL